MSKKTREDLRLDLIGLNVGQLTIIKHLGSNEKGHTIWLAKCECGNTKEVLGKDFKRGKGGTKCKECHLKEKSERAKKHGDNKSEFWNCWVNMKRRCHDVTRKYYGGRGITYDLQWEEYENFKKQMYMKYLIAKRLKYRGLKLSLERLDNNKNYNYENCAFIPLRIREK